MTTSSDYAISENERVQFLLSIAEKSANLAMQSVEPESNGFVCVVFSAAAVEAALNFFITIPLLFINSNELKRFYGHIITKRLRLNIPAKLSLAGQFSSPLFEREHLRTSIAQLFVERNAIVHSPIDYGEGLVVPNDADFSLSDQEFERILESIPSVRFKEKKLYDPTALSGYVRDAREFISMLQVVSPESSGYDAP